MFRFLSLSLLIIPLVTFGQKIAVVDVQKVFDGYQKVIDAKLRFEKSAEIAAEEIDIFKDELRNIIKEIREMEEKLKNPNIDSSSLKGNYQEKLRKLKEKEKDLVDYQKRTSETFRQRNLNLKTEALSDIRAEIAKISSSGKIDLVLNSAQINLAVMFASDKLDITENVILALNSSKKTE